MPQYVIVVPGFGGSELYTPPVLGLLPLRIWLDYASLITGGWRFLQLGTDGISPVIPGQGRLVPALALQIYYGTLSNYLAAAGLVPVSHMTDWRLQLRPRAQALADQIRELGQTQRVGIVCHSRGGLLVRLALSLLSGPELADLVGNVVGIGVPHYGSWSTAWSLGGFGPIPDSIRLLLYGVQAAYLPPGARGSIDAVIDSWPGLYELLPAPGAPGLNPDEATACYDPANWRGTDAPVSGNWLATAQTSWGLLPGIPPQVSWLHVVGMGTITPVRLRDLSTPWNPASYDLSIQGDGTVPAAWAQTAGHTVLLSSADHSSLPQSGDVMRQVVSWLRGG